MSMYLEKELYVLEGYKVTLDVIGSGRTGWRCECWKETPPDQGTKPSCFHTRAVEDGLRLKIPIDESGPKVVTLKSRR